MKLQYFLFLIVFLCFLSFACHAQIKLQVELLSESKETINIRLTSINTSSHESILFFTPTEWSFCGSIISIDFIQEGSKKEHEYFPCTEISDIDHTVLRKSNSVLLLPADSFSFEMNLKKNKISPYLFKLPYKMRVTFNYENGNFISNTDTKNSIYRGTITSNEILIQNK